jgi:hypothetical protein
MDLQSLIEAAVEETAQFFMKTTGMVPEQDSDAWEKEYRRHFEAVKKRSAGQPAAIAKPAAPVRAAATDSHLAELVGTPGEKRWAEELRAERLSQIQDKELRSWLGLAWSSAKTWIDTRSVAPPAFLRRIEAEHADYRRREAAGREAQAAADHAQAEAASALRRQVAAAGITVEGLIELIDISTRLKATPVKTKLAELDADGRNLRIFESGNAKALMVIEKGPDGKTEYAIERDEGLVADLKLYSQAAALS